MVYAVVYETQDSYIVVENTNKEWKIGFESEGTENYRERRTNCVLHK